VSAETDGGRGTAPRAPAPWGSPPTPLLPRWYINRLAELPLPTELRNLTAPPQAATRPLLRSLGDLPTFWEHRSTPVDNDLLRLIVDLVADRWPPSDYVILPIGTDFARLLECPLRKRTKTGLARAVIRRQLSSDAATTVGDLKALRRFGIMSLLDLMCIAEADMDNGFLRAGHGDTSPSVLKPSADGQLALDDKRIESEERSAADGNQTTDSWNSARRLLNRILRASRDFRGSHTLGDALADDLVGLAGALGIVDDLEGVLISDLTGGMTLAEEVLLTIIAWQRDESLSPIEQLVIEQRILAREPATLEAIGHKTNLSRERIRQLERQLRITVESTVVQPIDAIAALMHEQLDPIVSEGDLDEHISSTFFSAISPHATEEAIDIARHLLRCSLGYSCKDRICLSSEAAAVVEQLQAAGGSLADDAGLVNEAELRAHLPDDDWQQHWEVLLDRCEFQLISGQLAQRATAKARVKAALLQIGHPATKEEVAARSGLTPDRAGAQLSLLKSVVRADKVRWGLAEWIDDEYEGIPAEIVQRINEDGGSTRLDRLLDEIPRRFGVSESSVRAYVETPAFQNTHGWVSLADDAPIAVGRFDDVASGRDENNDPYWTFQMHERYLRGYSIAGIPPELAVALGCTLGGQATATVRAPAGGGTISLNWRKTSILGPDIGRTSTALAAIAVRHGDTVCMVIHSPDEVSFVPFKSLHSPPGLNAETRKDSTPTTTDGFGPIAGVGRSTGVRVAGTVRGRIRQGADAPAGTRSDK
jgi:hypothetical protein